MGQEAECTVRVGKKSSAGKALLESEVLVFRGEFRLDIPFGQMKDVAVDGGALVVRTDDSEARLELGTPTADKWARLIKEPKGLFEKLEVGAESRVAVVDVSDIPFLTAIRERAASVVEGRVPGGAAVIFFGVETRDALRKLALLRARMVETGVLWLIRPKASKVVTERDVFEAVRAAGLVDTKVVAFSKTHTAHKTMIPAEMRGQAFRRPPIVSMPPPAPGSAPAVKASAKGTKTAMAAAPKVAAAAKAKKR
jgi:hypothetical protein